MTINLHCSELSTRRIVLAPTRYIQFVFTLRISTTNVLSIVRYLSLIYFNVTEGRMTDIGLLGQ